MEPRVWASGWRHLGVFPEAHDESSVRTAMRNVIEGMRGAVQMFVQFRSRAHRDGPPQREAAAVDRNYFNVMANPLKSAFAMRPT